MLLSDSSTYYEILELAPDASPQEIRSAYLRTKAAFRKDSAALYTLIEEGETEVFLAKIEEAYNVLSNAEKRKIYDKNHGLLSNDETTFAQHKTQKIQKIISIDRVPPMDSSTTEHEILVPPATDFPAVKPPPTVAQTQTAEPSVDPAADKIKNRISEEENLQREIGAEVEWRGNFLRKIREIKKISLEEMADFTKISKTYIIAIENDNYDKLPAPVYLRGFVIQICKYLKLPFQKVSDAYMTRYKLTKLDKK